MSKPYADSKVHIEKLEKRKPKPRTENHLVPLEKSHPSPSKKCGSQQDSYITRFGDPQMKQATHQTGNSIKQSKDIDHDKEIIKSHSSKED